MRVRPGWLVCATAASVMVACGGDQPIGPRQVADVMVHAILPTSVRSLVVNVTGPGIASGVLVNIPVGADSVARATIELPAGSGRRFVITAVDTAGVATHRGDTTVTLVPGPNPPLAMTLRPLAASSGFVVHSNIEGIAHE